MTRDPIKYYFIDKIQIVAVNKRIYLKDMKSKQSSPVKEKEQVDTVINKAGGINGKFLSFFCFLGSGGGATVWVGCDVVEVEAGILGGFWKFD